MGRDYTTQTPAELNDRAAKADQAAADSFDRCDTDGFLTQWASGISARLYRAQAAVAEAGGMAEFPALFHADTGELVAAKYVDTRFGGAWGLLSNDDPHSSFTGWVSTSVAASVTRRRNHYVRKGFTLGVVLAPAKAKVCGSGTGLSGAANAYVATIRTDGGFSRDVTVVTTDAHADQMAEA